MKLSWWYERTYSDKAKYVVDGLNPTEVAFELLTDSQNQERTDIETPLRLEEHICQMMGKEIIKFKVLLARHGIYFAKFARKPK